MPIILMAVLLTGLVVVDQEAIIPTIVPQLTRGIDDLKRTEKTFSIPAMQDDKGALLTATRYHPATVDKGPWMQVVDIIERKENLQPGDHIYADAMFWNEKDQCWTLLNGRRAHDVISLNRSASTAVPELIYKSNINPEEVALYQSGSFVDLLSIHRINQLLDPSRRNSYGSRDLLRAKHTRVTQWLMNIVLLLLSIPAVLTREPNALRSAAVKCLLLTGTCLGAIALANSLAGQPPPNPRYTDIWPALMAWLPVFIFGPISIWLLDRVKT